MRKFFKRGASFVAMIFLRIVKKIYLGLKYVLKKVNSLLKWFFLRGSSTALDKESKKFSLLIKRVLIVVLITLVSLLTWGLYTYKQNLNDIVIRKIEVSFTVSESGISENLIRLKLQEAKEETQDYLYKIPRSRIAYDDSFTEFEEESQLKFEIEGFGFGMNNIIEYLGKKLFGKKREIRCAILAYDTVGIQAIIRADGHPVETFVCFYEKYSNRIRTLDELCRKICYKILEITDPSLIGEYYLETNQFERCLRLATIFELREDETEYMRVKFLKCRVLELTKNYEEHKIFTDSMLKLFPKQSAFMVEKALNYMGRNKQDSAIVTLKQILKVFPDQLFANYNLGRIYLYSLHKYDSSELYYKRCLDIDPTHGNERFIVSAAFDLSFCYFLQKKFRQADKYFCIANNLSPSTFRSSTPLLTWYRINDEKRWFEKYVDSLKGNLRLDSTSLMFNYSYGLILQMNGKESEALRYFDKCMKYFPEFQHAYISKSQILFFSEKDKNYWRGDSLISIVFGKNPDNYIAREVLAESLEERKLFNQAVSLYYSILNVDKFSLRIYNDLSRVLFQKGDIKEAMDLTYRFSQYYPDDPLINYLIGFDHFGSNNDDKCIHHLEKALQGYSPNWFTARAHELLGDVYLRSFEASLALNHFQKAISFPENKSRRTLFMFKLFWCYSLQGDFQKVQELSAYFENFGITPPEFDPNSY